MTAEHPDPRIADAHRYLDDTGDILARGLPVSPDYLMRALVALRDGLNRHQPDVDLRRCGYCGRTWICPDVASDLAVLGVDRDYWDAQEGDR